MLNCFSRRLGSNAAFPLDTHRASMDKFARTIMVMVVFYTGAVVLVTVCGTCWWVKRAEAKVSREQDMTACDFGTPVVYVLDGRAKYHHRRCHHVKNQHMKAIAKMACANCAWLWSFPKHG